MATESTPPQNPQIRPYMILGDRPMEPRGGHQYGPPVVVEVMVKVQALAFEEADGRYSVVVPELRGCITDADSIDDVPAMVREAAEGWLAAGHDLNRERAIRDVTEPFPSEREARP